MVAKCGERSAGAICVRTLPAADIFAMFSDRNSSPGGISSDSFRKLCRSLLSAGGEMTEEASQLSATAFPRFDKNSDGILDEDEFTDCYSSWIEPTLRPKNCLLIVDVQNDFITGTLALKDSPAKQDGAEVVPLINQILADYGSAFQTVAYTLDWHPTDHCSFLENVHRLDLDPNSQVSADNVKPFDVVTVKGDPSFEQALFPAHCVQGSKGAEFHPDLKILPSAHVIRKGLDSDVDSFSGFMDNNKKLKTPLDEVLTKEDITDVYICGLATDFCVGSSALDALTLGFRTIVIKDACRGCSDLGIAAMERRITEQGGLMVNSTDLSEMLVNGSRRLDLAVQGLSVAALKRRRKAHQISTD